MQAATATHDVLAAASAGLPAALELLSSLVGVNSHADNAEGVEGCLDLLTRPLEELGMRVARLRASGRHPDDGRAIERAHLIADRRISDDAPTLLLMGHVDTVYPVDHPFRRLHPGAVHWRGPGVADMKGGLVTAILTLRLLERAGRLGQANWRVLLVTDEEQGSPTGQKILREVAPTVDVALSFEAARACGGLVVERKGHGVLKVRITGKTGHAGIEHDAAVNAFTAMCRFVVAAEALEERYPGLSVSPGGAVAAEPPHLSSVPDQARCALEWRFADPAAGSAALADLRALAAELAALTGARFELDGGIEVAPMHASERSRALLAHYVEAARGLGMEIDGVATAGVGDINEVAGFGATCLDGVGPEGGAMHSDGEFLVVDSIARRAAMNAVAIGRLLDGGVERTRC